MGVLGKQSPDFSLLLCCKDKWAFLRDSYLGSSDYLSYFPLILLPKLHMNIQDILMIIINGAFCCG